MSIPRTWKGKPEYDKHEELQKNRNAYLSESFISSVQFLNQIVLPNEDVTASKKKLSHILDNQVIQNCRQLLCRVENTFRTLSDMRNNLDTIDSALQHICEDIHTIRSNSMPIVDDLMYYNKALQDTQQQSHILNAFTIFFHCHPQYRAELENACPASLLFLNHFVKSLIARDKMKDYASCVQNPQILSFYSSLITTCQNAYERATLYVQETLRKDLSKINSLNFRFLLFLLMLKPLCNRKIVSALKESLSLEETRHFREWENHMEEGSGAKRRRNMDDQVQYILDAVSRYISSLSTLFQSLYKWSIPLLQSDITVLEHGSAADNGEEFVFQDTESSRSGEEYSGGVSADAESADASARVDETNPSPVDFYLENETPQVSANSMPSSIMALYTLFLSHMQERSDNSPLLDNILRQRERQRVKEATAGTKGEETIPCLMFPIKDILIELARTTYPLLDKILTLNLQTFAHYANMYNTDIEYFFLDGFCNHLHVSICYLYVSVESLRTIMQVLLFPKQDAYARSDGKGGVLEEGKEKGSDVLEKLERHQEFIHDWIFSFLQNILVVVSNSVDWSTAPNVLQAQLKDKSSDTTQPVILHSHLKYYSELEFVFVSTVEHLSQLMNMLHESFSVEKNLHSFLYDFFKGENPASSELFEKIFLQNKEAVVENINSHFATKYRSLACSIYDSIIGTLMNKVRQNGEKIFQQEGKKLEGSLYLANHFSFLLDHINSLPCSRDTFFEDRIAILSEMRSKALSDFLHTLLTRILEDMQMKPLLDNFFALDTEQISAAPSQGKVDLWILTLLVSSPEELQQFVKERTNVSKVMEIFFRKLMILKMDNYFHEVQIHKVDLHKEVKSFFLRVFEILIEISRISPDGTSPYSLADVETLFT